MQSPAEYMLIMAESGVTSCGEREVTFGRNRGLVGIGIGIGMGWVLDTNVSWDGGTSGLNVSLCCFHILATALLVCRYRTTFVLLTAGSTPVDTSFFTKLSRHGGRSATTSSGLIPCVLPWPWRYSYAQPNWSGGEGV